MRSLSEFPRTKWLVKDLNQTQWNDSETFITFPEQPGEDPEISRQSKTWLTKNGMLICHCESCVRIPAECRYLDVSK